MWGKEEYPCTVVLLGRDHYFLVKNDACFAVIVLRTPFATNAILGFPHDIIIFLDLISVRPSADLEIDGCQPCGT
jgi:hypothetical protein